MIARDSNIHRLDEGSQDVLGAKMNWYLSFVPPTGRVHRKAFIRWVRTQGRCPDTLGIPRNASGPVGIPRNASGPVGIPLKWGDSGKS